MIDYSIDLNFLDDKTIQKTNILVNQANRDSVNFNFRIKIGEEEINYLNYKEIGIVLRKADGTNVTGELIIHTDKISYLVHKDGLAKAGIVLGQLDLYPNRIIPMEDGGIKQSTLYFQFNVLEDLLNSRQIKSSTHLGQLEEIIVNARLKAEEIEELLRRLEGEGFITGEQLVEALNALATVAKTGNYDDLKNVPTSLPANGGNADTVENIGIDNLILAGTNNVNEYKPQVMGQDSHIFLGNRATNYNQAICFMDSTNNPSQAYAKAIIGINPSNKTLMIDTVMTTSEEKITGFAPRGDGYLNLGVATGKWNDIYARNAIINTSDEKEKENIKPMDDKYINFLMDLEPIIYKFKNDDSNTYLRMHAGLGARQVEDALYKNGLNSLDFAGLCISPITEEIEGELQIIGEKYGLRYEEFIPIIIKIVQKIVEKQQKEFIDLENKYKKQQKQINDFEKRLAKLEG